MKVRCILLAVTLLAGVAADKPQHPDEDLIAISNAARDYRPDGCTLAEVKLGPTKNTAYVRYLVRRETQDIVLSVLTLKKTTKRWEVESLAR